MRRAVLVAIASAWLVAVAPLGVAHAAPMFSDVPSTHWAHDAVKALAEKGIIEGYPTTPAPKPPPRAAPAKKPTPPKKTLPR